MKTLILLSAFVSTSALAAGCPNLSGKYLAPYEGENSDVVTTITYSQTACDSLTISAISLGKQFFESQSKVYYPKTLSLKGLDAPRGLECLNAYYGVCASYLAMGEHIAKTSDEVQISADPVHGACFYKTSFLSKDTAGNLVEAPQNVKCEDDFTGAVAPIVWPKAPARN